MSGSEPPVIAEGLFSFQIGGSERVGVDLALEFARRGFRVVCFAFYDSDGPMRSELERAGIRCLDMNYERGRPLSRRVTYQWRMYQMLRRERVSALHVHHATALILCGIPAALAGIDRVVMTEHGLYQLIERPSYRRSAQRYCRYAHDITVVDPLQADYFRDEMDVPASKLHYVANGVRLNLQSKEQIASVRQMLGIPADSFLFVYVGRLTPVKDLDVLLRAFAWLSGPGAASWRLCLVGDGAERERLEGVCGELGLRERVSFLGARSDVSRILPAADAFVMSSRTEGLPMALLEAMACGVPCVATAVGGIPALLANDRGILVPPQDPRRLSEAMATLQGSPELRSRIAASALENVRKHYSLDSVTDRYLALLGLPPRWPH